MGAVRFLSCTGPRAGRPWPPAAQAVSTRGGGRGPERALIESARIDACRLAMMDDDKRRRDTRRRRR